MNVIDKIEKQQCKESVADFNVGDTVTVSTKIVEGSTERIQNFTGVVIARKNSGIRETFTVRRVSFGYGVEKIFPLHSPASTKSLSIARAVSAAQNSTTCAARSVRRHA